ncbi:MAG: hypothetical protein BWY82_01769 [Verrucomicrobia bacterium ADurb.Bin474]|nr:MAG: hypothetical protein BWY82_01769 [Verrucomicrobia bacterium ADurb.Bin474]
MGHVNGVDFGYFHDRAGFFEEFTGEFPLADDHPEYAKITGVGQSEGVNIHTAICQHAEVFGEATCLILDEYRYLMKFHDGVSWG